VEACCGRYLSSGDATAPTAERLMRSRYTAFAVGDMDHLLRTWHPSTRPLALRDDPGTTWTGLEVLATTGGGLFDTEGTVRFVAHHTADGEPGELAETSRFVREDGRWWYVEPV
jgi:SEC-C motif domain protein